jgi:hypothetical protein
MPRVRVNSGPQCEAAHVKTSRVELRHANPFVEATDAVISKIKHTASRHLSDGNRYNHACSGSYCGRRFDRGAVLYKLVIECCSWGVYGRDVQSIAATAETDPIGQEPKDMLFENVMAYFLVW